MMACYGGARHGAPSRSFRKRLASSLPAFLLGGLALYATVVAPAELRTWRSGPPPVLDLAGLDGNRYQLAELRGKVVLVNFWATWCDPCREEMPSIQRLKERLAGRRFVALAVNLDEPETRIRKFLSQNSLNLTVLLDPGRKAAKAWNARILPASFIIGPDGRVRYSAVGEIDWNNERAVSQIADLLPPKP